MSVRMNMVMSEELKEQLDALPENNSETVRKALALYLEVRKRTRNGNTRLGFFDAETKQVEGEIVGL